MDSNKNNEDIEKTEENNKLEEKENISIDENKITLGKIGSPEDAKIIEDVEEVSKGKITDYKLLGIIIAIVIIALIIIFAMPYFYKEEVKTINEMHKEVLDGKENEDQYMYNGYSFIRIGDENIGYMWYTQIMDPYSSIKYDIPLHYGPKEVEDININGDINYFTELIYSKNNYLEEYDAFNINTTELPYIAYFSFDPNSYDLDYINLAHHELRTNLLQVFTIRLLPACTEEDKACETVAILTCENTTLPIIVFEEANGDSIRAKGNCITIRSYNTGMVKAVDRLLYQMYGIME